VSGRRGQWCRWSLVALLTALLPVGVAAAQAPPLDGETLSGVPTVSNITCDLVAQPTPHSVGSFDFDVSGAAAGPYPGTFVETGTVQVDALNGATIHASYTIDSPAGTVTGTKDAVNAFGNAVFASCPAVGGIGDVVGAVGIPVTYHATIDSDTGTSNVSGPGTISVTANELPALPATGTFSETFDASAPLLPTSKEQCKREGFAVFGVFKNQGDCVAFIATNGANEPG
jgi:hypothetical protein